MKPEGMPIVSLIRRWLKDLRNINKLGRNLHPHEMKKAPIIYYRTKIWRKAAYYIGSSSLTFPLLSQEFPVIRN